MSELGAERLHGDAAGGSDDELQRQAIGWLGLLKSGSATSADVDAFRQWSTLSSRHAGAFAEAHRMWNGVGPAGLKVIARLGHEPAPPRLDRRFVLTAGLAAGVAAAGHLVIDPPFDLWPSFSELALADIRTGTGERRSLKLPSNVGIELNTRTAIALRSARAGTARFELLAGESLVSANGACEVLVDEGRAQARAASFCVRRDADTVRITVLTGAVSAWFGAAATTIGAGQQFVHGPSRANSVSRVDADAVTAWRTGQLIFHDTTLNEVVAEANRYRRGRIIIANRKLGSRIVDARIRLDEIDDLVAKLAAAFGARETSLPGGLVILI